MSFRFVPLLTLFRYVIDCENDPTAILSNSHIGQTDQIDHDLDHLGPNLTLWNVMQDLYSAGPTQETRLIMQILRLPPGNMMS